MTQFDVSVIIPTCGRPTKLENCLDALARQMSGGPTFEIIVAIDGDEHLAEYQQIDAPSTARFLSLPWGGVSAARNAAMEVAQGRLLIFTNDDTYPSPSWIIEHVRAQMLRASPGMVIGRTEWTEWPEHTIFDELLRRTSMIFFYDRMRTAETYGFRHFWTCNASIPREMAIEVGGFEERLCPVFYEDLEFAFRVEQAGFPGVYYHADARNTHDHRLDWDEYCRREASLGAMAASLAMINLDCFAAIFGDRDSSRLKASYEAWLALDCNDHQFLEQQMRSWHAKKVENIANIEEICPILHALHVPLKRRIFRTAFVEQLAKLKSATLDNSKDVSIHLAAMR